MLLYGIAISKYSSQFGLNKILTSIIPHGIIEYIALALFFSCSVEINFSLYQYFLRKNDAPVSIKVIKKIIIAFILIVLAALVEVYLTPLILEYYEQTT